mgnify:CR=1 FL=1
MPQVITIGETMAAFTPCESGPLRYIRDYRLRIAGAESNTAIGLAKLGVGAVWLSRLGEDEFGHFVCNQIRAEGVDCSRVVFDKAHRTGLMVKETGAGETRVYYYRENSAASFMRPQDLDEGLFAGVGTEKPQILHLTGITPVLSESCRQTLLAAVTLAKQHGLLLSFDPNIRKKLWRDTDYSPLLRELALQSEIVLLGLDEAEALFGLRKPDAIFARLFAGGCARYAAIKNGAEGAWAADGGHCLRLPPHPCRCVEPIGAGDGFNAGFLAGILQTGSIEAAGRMGCACGALATQTPGDIEGYPDAARLHEALAGAGTVYR